MTPLPKMRNVARNAYIIPRPRLLEKLQDAVDCKLTLITAPPGYGKTILASQFAERSPITVAWQSLEDRDRDPTLLFESSLDALSRVLPEKPTRLVYGNQSPTELAALAAEYVRRAKQDIIYILDDIQSIEGAEGAETWLDAFVEMAPPQCHLILVGRTVPDLSSFEYLEREQVISIGTDDLRLNTEEIERLASDVLGPELETERLGQIGNQLEGWPAGIVLAFYPLPEELERAFFKKGQGGPEAHFQTLAESLLNAQSPTLRDFLLQSSTLPTMTPDVLEGALKLNRAGHYLAEVAARNLFVRQTPNGLVYHSLFRAFLQERLQRANALRFLNLHLQAAQYFEEGEDIEAAFSHFVIAQQHQRAAELANRVAEAYFSQGRLETLLGWENTLRQAGTPPAQLVYNCAVIHTDRNEYALAETRLDEAEAIFRQQHDQASLSKLIVQRARNEMRQGDYARAEARLLGLIAVTRPTELVHGYALAFLGYTYLDTGELEKARENLSAALPILKGQASGYAQAQAQQTLGVVYERMGRLVEARSCLQESISTLSDLGGKRSLARALNNLGYYFFLGSNYQQAREIYDKAHRLVTQSADKEIEAALLWNLGDLFRDLNDIDRAEKTYQSALQKLGGREPVIRCYILLSMALMYRWQQQWPDALIAAREAEEIAQAGNLSLQRRVAQVLIWATNAEIDKPIAALKELETLVEDLRNQQARIKLLSALAMCSHVALRAKRNGLAKSYLLMAVELSEELGTAQPLAMELRNSEPLHKLWHALECPGEHLRQDLKALDKHPGKAQAENKPSRKKKALPMPTYNLRVVTFGQLTVFRDGQQLSDSDWRSAAARELFLCLLFEGSQHKNQIALAFWPDCDQDTRRSNFHTALKRARSALGQGTISFANQIYGWSPTVKISCDAFELEALVSQARLLALRDAQAEHLFRRAIGLCGDDFLHDIDKPWLLHYRAKYHELRLEAHVGLAKCLVSRGDYTGALRSLKQASTWEPYREDIHRLVMSSYAGKGDKRKVLEHYGMVLELFKKDLGIEPGEDTRQLFATIMR